MHPIGSAALPAVALLLGMPGCVLPPARSNTEILLRFPANDPKGELFTKVPVAHVDHDPGDANAMDCINYAGKGFPWCYNGHDGTDYLLAYGFATMDAHDVEVVAAAPGTVAEAVDGNYDRCHLDTGFEVSCDGRPMVANQVILRHDDGSQTRYAHLKNGSVKVRAGDRVACGDGLGFVGSSGMSLHPHLHFELSGANGSPIDPYGGPRSQPESYWVLQDGPNGFPGSLCADDD